MNLNYRTVGTKTEYDMTISNMNVLYIRNAWLVQSTIAGSELIGCKFISHGRFVV